VRLWIVIQIELQPETEAELTAEAKARGLALDRYIVQKLLESRPASGTRQHSVSVAIDNIHALRKGNRLDGAKIKDLIHEGHKY
jgi:hypothetical protein